MTTDLSNKRLSDNAKAVLNRRYLKKDEKGQPIEKPEDMFKRVAKHIAKAEKLYGGDQEKQEELFYDMMINLDFLPNSPTLMNAGRELGQLAGCFVIPIDDSMEGIFDAVKNGAMIHKSGGGTGYSFSKLRAKNSRVGTTGGVASGPVSFMRVFNAATEQVKQGSFRRGANMAVLRVDHPDVFDFINCKKENGDFSNFNISIGITEEFIQAVKENRNYKLINPNNEVVIETLNAKKVYDAIIQNAWFSGDPGLLFLDEINKYNPTPAIGKYETSNPCGEQILLPNEACNLGSINLSNFVKNKTIDYDRLELVIQQAVRFLDNVIDMSKYPLPEIEKTSKGNRKIGLGVMGFADLLYQLEIPYNSDEALEIAEKTMEFVNETAQIYSEVLSTKRGTFPYFDKSIFKIQRRNATVTTIAPTGTLSIIANCSSGIEPLFALAFNRTIMDNDKFTEINSYFEKVAKEEGFYSKEFLDELSETGSIQHIDYISDKIKKIFVTSHDISPEWHIKMQAAFQKYTENAVSKTVNLPSTATVEDVKQIYDLAYELKCKGVTVYRDGCKENQVLSTNKKQKKNNDFWAVVEERPETLEGFTAKIVTGLGTLYVTVTEYNDKPFEVFAQIGKSGKSAMAKTEAIGRLISLSLRAGVTVEKIIDQIEGIHGEYAIFQKNGLVLSIPDAIATILKKRYMNGKKNGKVDNGNLLANSCPECGAQIANEEGCLKCHACGYSKC